MRVETGYANTESDQANVIGLLVAVIVNQASPEQKNSLKASRSGMPEPHFRHLMAQAREVVMLSSMSKVKQLSFSETGMGPPQIDALAEVLLTGPDGAGAPELRSLTVDSTGIAGKPKPYTLAEGASKVDLSGLNLGRADVTLLAKLIRSGSRMVIGMVSLNVLLNPEIGVAGLKELVGAVQETDNIIQSLVGKASGQTAVDLSGRGLGPSDVQLLTADVRLRRAMHGISSLDVSDNVGILGLVSATSVGVGSVRSSGEMVSSAASSVFGKTGSSDDGLFAAPGGFGGSAFAFKGFNVPNSGRMFSKSKATPRNPAGGFAFGSFTGVGVGGGGGVARAEAPPASRLPNLSTPFSFGGTTPTAAVSSVAFCVPSNDVTLISGGDASNSAGKVGSKSATQGLNEFRQLLEVLGELESLETLKLASIGMGTDGVGVLTSALLGSPKMIAGLRSLTVDSTGIAGKPKTYTLAEGASEVDLSGLNLGRADASLVAGLIRLGSRTVGGLVSLNVLRNPALALDGVRTLVGAVQETPSVVSLIGVVEGQREVDLSGAELDASDVRLMAAEMELGRVLASEVTWLSTRPGYGRNNLYTLASGMVEVELMGIGLGRADMQLLAAAMLSTHLMQTVQCLNVLGNPEIGSEGLQILVSAVEQTPSVVSLSGVLEGQRILKLSAKELGTMDAEVLAAEFRLERESVQLTELDVSWNSLFADGKGGNTNQAALGDGNNATTASSGGDAGGQSQQLVDALHMLKPLERLDLSETGMMANHVVALTAIFDMPNALGCLKSLTLCSTGSKKATTYTLALGLVKIDLVGKGIGPADAQLLAATMLSTQLMQSVRCLNVLRNPELGLDGMQTLVSAVEQTSSVVSLIGVAEGQREVDLSGAELDASDVRLIVAEMKLGRVLASEVTSLKVPVMGGSISGASGSYTLCAGVGQLDLSGKQLGPADVDVLVAALMYGRTLLAGVTAVDLSQNELLWSAGCGRLAELVAGLEQTGMWELDLSGTGLGA
eukprot:SAG11_NODE_2324_length_3522_cov_8.494888_1_plen_1006_part_10